MCKLINRFCKPIDIKFVYSTFKIKNLFNVKDPLSDRLLTHIVYKFSCASCNSCYVGEIIRHFSKLMHKHMSLDRLFHVYKHLQVSESCHTSCNLDCFKILDSPLQGIRLSLRSLCTLSGKSLTLINRSNTSISCFLYRCMHTHLLILLTLNFICSVFFSNAM